MILVMVLSFFLLISGVVVEESTIAGYTSRIFERIYLKEQCYYQAKVVFDTYIRYFLKYKNKHFDSLSEFWANPYIVPLEDGKIEVYVIDEERFFNINQIKKPYGMEIIRRMFRELRITSISPEKVYTWITGKGFWEGKLPPKGKAMASIEELLYIGMSDKDFYGKTEGFRIYPGAKDVFTVWGDGKVNINTAPKVVLRALFPPEYQDVVEEVIRYRKEHPFEKKRDLLMVNGVDFTLMHTLSPWIKVKSSYYKFIVKVQRGGVEGTLVVIVKVNGSVGKIVFWRYS